MENHKNNEEQIKNNLENKSKKPNTESMLESILNEPEIKEKKVFSINIDNFDDILKIILNNEYEYSEIVPETESVKIVFYKEGKKVQEKFTKYHTYSNILIKIKNITGLNSDNKKQEGDGDYKFNGGLYKIKANITPENLGEKIKVEPKLIIKTKASTKSLLTFTGSISFILFVVATTFITFIVTNAQSVEDVMFFNSLGISLNDINFFIGRIVNVAFSSVISVEVILFAIFGIKFFLTKKEKKKRRFIFGIMSVTLIISLFSSGVFWLATVKKINTLPNWQEMSYGEVQLYDNTKLLLTDVFNKSDALIKNDDAGNLIGPITVKFDLTYYQKKQERKGYKIEGYSWDFGDQGIIKEISPIVYKTFNRKGTYNIKIIANLKKVDGSITQEEVENVPPIGIKYLVNIEERETESGGKKITLDASDLNILGKVEWYMEDDFKKPIMTGDKFTPPKIILKKTTIGIYIRKEGKKSKTLDKIITISGIKETEVGGEIEAKIYDRDLDYEFKAINIKKGKSDGFIEEYIWKIGDIKRVLKNKIGNEEESSKIKYTFPRYGEYEIFLTLKDSYGKTKIIKKTINVTKQLKIKKGLIIYNGEDEIKPIYDNNIYNIHDLRIPAKLNFDARLVRTDNPFNVLESVVWKYDGKERTQKTLDFPLNYEGKINIKIKYTFKNIKDGNLSNITDTIFINSIKKDVLLDLQIKPSEEEYAPAIIKFDASRSEIKGKNITKFIYDYGDGTKPEERDSINEGHKYISHGEYIIKLTVVTSDGKKYSTSKKLILKPKPQIAKIKTSLKTTTTFQGIDFSSSESEGQIRSYFWDFGDGNNSTEANPTHKYTRPGIYKVTLKLEFSNNNILEDEIDIIIN